MPNSQRREEYRGDTFFSQMGSIREIEVIQGTNGPTAWTEVAAAARSARQRKRGSCTRYPCPDRIERWSSLIDNGSACLPHCAA